MVMSGRSSGDSAAIAAIASRISSSFISPISASQAQWPPNLPAVEVHSPIRVTGLVAWIRSLDLGLQHVMIQFLFNWDSRNGTADPELFTRPILTEKLAQAYDMVGAPERTSFVELVKWTGLQDEFPVPTFPPASVEEVGFCYLSLLTPAGAAVARGVLGRNPWAPTLAGYLLSNPGVWSSDKFAMQLGLRAGNSNVMAYTQAHITPGHLTVKQLLPFFCGTVRVGAQLSDLNAILNMNATDEAPAVKTVYDRKPTGESRVVEMGLYAIVGGDTVKKPNFSWSIFSTPFMVATLGIYESVRIESASFTIKLDEGAENKGYFGIGSAGGTAPASRNDWYRLPISNVLDSSVNGIVAGTMELPVNHPFNPEMRYSTTFGTPPPVFYFAYFGAATGEMVITGKVKVRVAGLAPFGKVNIGGSGGVKSRDLKSHVASVQRDAGVHNLVAPGCAEEADSESESEDEDEPIRPPPISGSRSSPTNRPSA